MRLLVIFLITLFISTTAVSSSVSHSKAFSILAVEEMLGRVTILASADPRQRVSIPVGFKPHEIVVSADGKTAYVSNFGLNDADNRNGTPGDTVSVIDIENARVRTELHLPYGLKAPHGLGFRPQHSRELFVNAEQGDQMVVCLDSRWATTHCCGERRDCHSQSNRPVDREAVLAARRNATFLLCRFGRRPDDFCTVGPRSRPKTSLDCATSMAWPLAQYCR